MTISSRTPEGTPHRCPICNETVHNLIEYLQKWQPRGLD